MPTRRTAAGGPRFAPRAMHCLPRAGASGTSSTPTGDCRAGARARPIAPSKRRARGASIQTDESRSACLAKLRPRWAWSPPTPTGWSSAAMTRKRRCEMDEESKSNEHAHAPNRRTCATMQVHQRHLRDDPRDVRNRIASENRHSEARRTHAQGRLGITKIQVVVHVVHHTAAQNISDAQIASQIAVLNRDFQMKNSDLASIPAPFRPLAADARIEFALATSDPKGKPTN